MISRNRLRRSEDFGLVRKTGRAFHHAWMTLSTAANGLPETRCGFITSKQLGNAVTRNRVRRQMRAIMRGVLAELKPGYDIVLIARPPVVGQPFAAQTAVVHTLIQRAGLWLEKA
jgi:ribonuclease P protein component